MNDHVCQTQSFPGRFSSYPPQFLGPELKWLCNPVLSCHSCLLAWFACPIGVFVHYSGYHLFPLLAAGMVLVVGVLVGRLLCGWVCPLGFLLDMLYKIPSPKFVLPNWTRYSKYVILAVMVIGLPFMLGSETIYSFCRFCPASAIQVTIPNLIQTQFSSFGVLTGTKLAVLAGVLVLGVLSSRSFCKVFCPIAALLAPLNFVSFWAVQAPVRTCQVCGTCDAHCPTNGFPSTRVSAGIPANRALECIICHDCQQSCSHKEAPAGEGVS